MAVDLGQIDRNIARNIVDQLKSGTTPLAATHYLDVGRDRWYRGMNYFLENAAEGGVSKVRFIRGKYGDGKTHLMGMAQHHALQSGFVVSYASAENTRIDKFEQVYSQIVRNLRSLSTSGGIGFILRDWRERVGQDIGAEAERLRDEPGLDINFRIAVTSYLQADDPEHQDRIVQWLLGEPVKLAELGIRRSLRAGDSRDMMRSLSIFLRHIGYSGLLVLLDELDRIQYQTDRILQGCYQVLRELMDNTDGQGGMKSTLFYCAAPSEMFESERGFAWYDALRSRLEPDRRVLDQRPPESRVDYRGTIINLEDTPLKDEDLLEIAVRIRDIHSVALGWDAKSALTDEKLAAIVSQIVDGGFNISSPRLIATTVAIVADLEEQGQSYNIAEEISHGHLKAEEARAARHYRRYED